MKTVELYARVRHAVLIEGISERAPRPPHASRPCPRDERRQLQARSLQAPVTPSPIRAAVGRCPSGMKRDKQEVPRYRGLLACVRAALLLRPAAAKSLRR